jgi:hypothetical protein
MMNWKGCGRKRSCSNLRYYPGICLEGLRKTTIAVLRVVILTGDLPDTKQEYEPLNHDVRSKCARKRTKVNKTEKILKRKKNVVKRKERKECYKSYFAFGRKRVRISFQRPAILPPGKYRDSTLN